MARKLNPATITAALKEDGEVASCLPFYETRQAQLDLAELVVRAFNEDCLAAAEAGTGVGKSFAYLVPALRYAIENKQRVVISTATITLQKQLYEKDIPLVAAALGGGFKVILMKGRGNYLCLRRLEEALREPLLDKQETDEIERISEWSKDSQTGERDTLPFLPSETAWASICSESDACMGAACPLRENCFVLSLRKQAADAHIVVVNHHLLFADLAARYQGAGYETAVVLPPFNRLIIDEAQGIEKAATSFFSQEFSSTGIYSLLGRLYSKRRQRRRGLLVKLCSILPGDNDGQLDRAAAAMEKIRSRAEELEKAAFEFCGSEGVLRLSPYSKEDAMEAALFPSFKALGKSIHAFTELVREMAESLDEEEIVNPVIWETKTILRRLDGAAAICGAFPEYRSRQNEVLWIERHRYRNGGQAARFTVTPLDMSPILKKGLFSPNKTVVCLSATLTVNNDFGYWANRCGIGEIEGRPLVSGCFPSPFPYSSAVLLAAPTDSPLPDEEGWQDFINQAVRRLITVSGGSALVLFTSYQSLQSAWDAANPALQSMGIRCLKQGDDDRSRLLRTFISDESSVLFGTDSFWEGVDAPGDTLRLVIICRLPFRSPGDPVFEARSEAVDKRGGSPFMELSLPEAIMKFKQGFGRLMRRSSDSGVVAVLDGRLLRKHYGKFFLSSLPETKTCFGDMETMLRSAEDFLF